MTTIMYVLGFHKPQHPVNHYIHTQFLVLHTMNWKTLCNICEMFKVGSWMIICVRYSMLPITNIEFEVMYNFPSPKSRLYEHYMLQCFGAQVFVTIYTCLMSKETPIDMVCLLLCNARIFFLKWIMFHQAESRVLYHVCYLA